MPKEIAPLHESANFESLASVTSAERPKTAELNPSDHQDTLEQAQAAVSKQASSAERSSLPPIIDERPQLIDSSVKAMRMRHNLKQVQNKLKPAEKSFSKLIHQPLVSKISESADKTVARPSGILGGGIAAFLGCLGYQILARQYGLPYNFSLFIVFFVAGFGLGLIGELVIHKLRRAT